MGKKSRLRKYCATRWTPHSGCNGRKPPTDTVYDVEGALLEVLRLVVHIGSGIIELNSVFPYQGAIVHKIFERKVSARQEKTV